MKHNPIQFFRIVGARSSQALLALLLLAPLSAKAADFTYVGGSPNGWTDAARWTPTPGAAGPDGVGVSVFGDTFTTVIQSNSVTLGSIEFATTLNGSQRWTIDAIASGTGNITLNSGGVGLGYATIINSSSGNGSNGLSFQGGRGTNVTLTLADDLHIINSGSATGPVTIGPIAIGRRITGTGNITIENYAASPDTSISINNSLGDSDFVGNINIARGTLLIGRGSNLGNVATNVITLGTDGAAQLRANTSFGDPNVLNNIVVAASSGMKALGSVVNNIGSPDFKGTVTLNDDLHLTFGATFLAHVMSLSGVVSGTGGIIVQAAAAGNLTKISGSNSFTGDTRLVSGVLQIDGVGGKTLAIQNSTLNMAGADAGTLVFGGATSTTVTQATLGGLKGSRNINLMNSNTSPAAVALSVGNNNSSNSYGGTLSGGGSLVKIGTGTQTLAAAQTYSGSTTVSLGTLVVSSAGSLASSAVTVGAGGTFVYNNNTTGYGGNVAVSGVLGGSGKLNGTISGSGQVGPGNSPGILTVAQVNPSGGLDFNFEFTATGSPTYGNNVASVNDVLRLTDGTTPFTASLNSGNTMSIYLNVGSLSGGNTFNGGFYTDRSASFLASISGANLDIYLFNAGGSTTYNGVNYDLYGGPLTFDLNTVAQTADFGGGNINGYVMQVAAVPEPGTVTLIGLGLGATLLLRRRNGRLARRA